MRRGRERGQGSAAVDAARLPARVLVAALMLATACAGSALPALAAPGDLQAPGPGEGRPAPSASSESVLAPALGGPGTLTSSAPRGYDPQSQPNALVSPTSAPPTTKAPAAKAPASGSGGSAAGPAVAGPVPNAVAAAAVANALGDGTIPSASGPIDLKLLTLPTSTGLVQVLDDLAAKQRDLSSQVRLLETALGNGSGLAAAASTAAALSGPPLSNFEAGRADQIVAQERQLLSQVDTTRSSLDGAGYPSLLGAPPVAEGAPKGGAGANAAGTSAGVAAGAGGASAAGVPAPVDAAAIDPRAAAPTPTLPANPTSVVPCAPSLLLRNACEGAQTARPAPDLVRASAQTFLVQLDQRRAELTRQLRYVQQDMEAAHLRSTTGIPQSAGGIGSSALDGGTSAAGATAASVGGLDLTGGGSAPPSAATAASALTTARQQLADVTQRLNAVARSHALTTSASGVGAQPSGLARADIPPDYLVLYQRAAATCRGLSWTILAAIGSIESSHGRSTLPGVRSGANYAGAMGPMQFLASSWAYYGVDADANGVADVYNPTDAVFGAARYLCNNGATDPASLRTAVWSYNHADWYVNRVLDLAIRYGTSGIDALATPTTAADLARNPNITFSPEARGDLLNGIVDPRVLNILAASATEHRLVVGVIKTGHNMLVNGTDRVSNHYYARAVDITAVDSVDVSATNYAALDLALSILTSNSSIRPSEFGSPWLELSAFPGAFSDGDHTDHLHIGYDG